MRIPFDIQYRPQIELGEYKVETRSGKTARVVCWDRVGTQLIVLVGKDEDVLTYNPDGTTGQQMQLPSDLFLITPEPELTEFEKSLADVIGYAISQSVVEPNYETYKFVKDWSERLLSLARKQLQPEINAEIEKAYKNADEVMYRKGKEDGIAEARNDISTRIIALKISKERAEEALKDLPRWKKCGEYTLRTYGEEHFEYRGDGHYLVMKGQEILLSDLEKLPGFKEDEK